MINLNYGTVSCVYHMGFTLCIWDRSADNSFALTNSLAPFLLDSEWVRQTDNGLHGFFGNKECYSSRDFSIFGFGVWDNGWSQRGGWFLLFLLSLFSDGRGGCGRCIHSRFRDWRLTKYHSSYGSFVAVYYYHHAKHTLTHTPQFEGFYRPSRTKMELLAGMPHSICNCSRNWQSRSLSLFF